MAFDGSGLLQGMRTSTLLREGIDTGHEHIGTQCSCQIASRGDSVIVCPKPCFITCVFAMDMYGVEDGYLMKLVTRSIVTMFERRLRRRRWPAIDRLD